MEWTRGGQTTGANDAAVESSPYKEHAQFAMQIVLSIGVSIFCMIEASKGDTGVFLPILTGIIGYWLPAPRPFGTTIVNTDRFYELKREIEELKKKSSRLGGPEESYRDIVDWDTVDVEKGMSDKKFIPVKRKA